MTPVNGQTCDGIEGERGGERKSLSKKEEDGSMVYYTCQTMMAYSQCIPADGHNTLLRAFIAAVAVCQRVSTILNSVLGMHMQVFIFFHALEIKTQSTANAMHSAAGGSRACVVDSQLDKTDACLPPTGRRGCSRCSQVLFQCVYGSNLPNRVGRR